MIEPVALLEEGTEGIEADRLHTAMMGPGWFTAGPFEFGRKTENRDGRERKGLRGDAGTEAVAKASWYLE